MSTKKSTPAESKEIAEFVKACRMARGLSQREFADKLGEGVSGPYVHSVEHGKWRYPVEFVARMTKAEKEVALQILTKYLKEDLGL